MSRNQLCALARMTVLTAAALLLSSANAVAQAVPAGAAAARPLQPGQIDTTYSRVYIFVGKTGLGHDHAVVGRLRGGYLLLDAAQNAGQLEFDMKSFLADTDEARRVLGLHGVTDASTQQKVTANMLGKDVLDVQRYATATFQVTSAVKDPAPGSNATQYLLDGVFTLHGVARPLRLKAQTERRGAYTRVRGGFTTRQTDHGITPYSKAFGAVGVADELKIWGDLWIGSTAN